MDLGNKPPPKSYVFLNGKPVPLEDINKLSSSLPFYYVNTPSVSTVSNSTSSNPQISVPYLDNLPVARPPLNSIEPSDTNFKTLHNQHFSFPFSIPNRNAIPEISEPSNTQNGCELKIISTESWSANLINNSDTIYKELISYPESSSKLSQLQLENQTPLKIVSVESLKISSVSTTSSLVQNKDKKTIKDILCNNKIITNVKGSNSDSPSLTNSLRLNKKSYAHTTKPVLNPSAMSDSIQRDETAFEYISASKNDPILAIVDNPEGSTVSEINSTMPSTVPEGTSDDQSTVTERNSSKLTIIPQGISSGQSTVLEGTSDGQSTMPEGTSNGQSTMPEGTSDGQSTVLEGTSNGQSTMHEGTSYGQSTVLEGTSDGQSTVPERTSDGQSTMPEGTSDGQSTMPERTSDGESTMHEETSDGESTMPEETSDGQSTMPEETSDGQSTMPEETLNGQSTMLEETSDDQSTMLEETSDNQSTVTEVNSSGLCTMPEETSDDQSTVIEINSSGLPTIPEGTSDSLSSVTGINSGKLSTVSERNSDGLSPLFEKNSDGFATVSEGILDCQRIKNTTPPPKIEKLNLIRVNSKWEKCSKTAPKEKTTSKLYSCSQKTCNFSTHKLTESVQHMLGCPFNKSPSSQQSSDTENTMLEFHWPSEDNDSMLEVFDRFATQNQEVKKVSNWTCIFCKTYFTRSLSCLEYHISKHIAYRPYICKVCKQDFVAPSFLVRHHQRSHQSLEIHDYLMCIDKKRKEYVEKVMLYIKATQELCLSKTPTSNMSVYKFFCPNCGYKYRDFIDLTRHLYREKKYFPFRCLTCNKTFVENTPSHFKKKHADTKPQFFVLPDSAIEFEILKIVQEQKLIIEQRKEALDILKKNGSYKCQNLNCSFVTVKKEELDSHVICHSSSNLYKCRYCYVTCNSEKVLAIHSNKYHNGLPLNPSLIKDILESHQHIHLEFGPPRVSYSNNSTTFHTDEGPPVLSPVLFPEYLEVACSTPPTLEREYVSDKQLPNAVMHDQIKANQELSIKQYNKLNPHIKFKKGRTSSFGGNEKLDSTISKNLHSKNSNKKDEKTPTDNNKKKTLENLVADKGTKSEVVDPSRLAFKSFPVEKFQNSNPKRKGASSKLKKIPLKRTARKTISNKCVISSKTMTAKKSTPAINYISADLQTKRIDNLELLPVDNRLIDPLVAIPDSSSNCQITNSMKDVVCQIDSNLIPAIPPLSTSDDFPELNIFDICSLAQKPTSQTLPALRDGKTARKCIHLNHSFLEGGNLKIVHVNKKLTARKSVSISVAKNSSSEAATNLNILKGDSANHPIETIQKLYPSKKSPSQASINKPKKSKLKNSKPTLAPKVPANSGIKRPLESSEINGSSQSKRKKKCFR